MTNTLLYQKFLDLDIIIRDNIDCFFEKEGEFYIVKDWDFPDDIIGNSSVFSSPGSISDKVSKSNPATATEAKSIHCVRTFSKKYR